VAASEITRYSMTRCGNKWVETNKQFPTLGKFIIYNQTRVISGLVHFKGCHGLEFKLRHGFTGLFHYLLDGIPKVLGLLSFFVSCNVEYAKNLECRKTSIFLWGGF